MNADESALGTAWSAWREGDVDRAAFLARETPSSDQRTHVLMLAAYVKGDYAQALDRYEQFDAGYARRTELEDVVVEAHLHLGQHALALAFARQRGLERAKYMATRTQPMEVQLDGSVTVAFADSPIVAYFPGFEGRVNGRAITAHMDTGGTFLHMHPAQAEKLGIELVAGPEGKHGANTVATLLGMADTFHLGPVLLKHVPVIAMPSLQGSQDFVIFGTNVFERFLATIDYPNQRLLLSARAEVEARNAHLAKLPEAREEVEFLLWGDHYMIARGGVGEKTGLNFFIDSGLVSLHPQPDGSVRQAALIVAREDLATWSAAHEETGQDGVVELKDALRLGSLAQKGHLILVREQGIVSDRGGIRIDGLLSHAFLKEYAWTIDFDARRYLFH